MAPIALARTFAIRCDESAVLAPQLPPSLFDRFGRRCRGKLNEKKTSAFGYARVFDLWVPAHATTITIDLGPPGRVTGEKIVSFSDLNDLPLSGQTLSLDLVFSGNGFVRLFKSTSPTFLLLPMLDVFGAGTINNPTGNGYLFDQAGNPISSVTSFGGSVTTDPGGEAFRLALGGFFPLLADGTFPPDIYGAHLDITLPNGPAFDVTGGEIGLFPNASQRWHDQFQIGDVPDSGCTLVLALIAVVLLFSLDAAIRRCPPRNVCFGLDKTALL